MVAVYCTKRPHANFYVFIACIPVALFMCLCSQPLPLNLTRVTPASSPPPSPGSIRDPSFTKSLNPPLC